MLTSRAAALAAAEQSQLTLELLYVYIPVQEMLRAGKVLPGKGGKAARIHTAKGVKGYMAVLEYNEDDIDVRIIFMLSELAEAA